MKIIQNKFIPFGSYLAMTIGPFIFTKDKSKINDTVLRHETIHYYQQAELGYIIFFIFGLTNVFINPFITICLPG